MTFDPYFKWLGIASEERPPSHYRLTPNAQEPAVKGTAKAEPKIADFAGTWTIKYKFGERQIVRVYTIDPQGTVFFHEENRRGTLGQAV